MERVGSWSGSGGLRTYSDPQVEYIFPLTLGSYNYDTWMNSASSSGGIYELSGIGYGTLITPTGTFNDAIMVRVFLEESFLSFYSYFWYSSTSGIILLQYIDGDGFFIPKLLTYASSISLVTGINSQKEAITFNYSNPVFDNLSLFFNSITRNELSYEIINSLGQKIMTGKIENTSIAAQISMKHLDNGLYFIKLREENSDVVKTLKFIKM
ncbi:MAG: T9SS type A sorting domain-containing protein [Bacteroidia bacterium]